MLQTGGILGKSGNLVTVTFIGDAIVTLVKLVNSITVEDNQAAGVYGDGKAEADEDGRPAKRRKVSDATQFLEDEALTMLTGFFRDGPLAADDAFQGLDAYQNNR